MPYSPFQFISDRHRARDPNDPLQRWVAVVLMLTAAAAAYLVFTRDVDWESRMREARQQGLTAERNGNFALARSFYESALANHPYDWETHLSLADILHHQLNNQQDALKHYLFALAYSPEPSIAERVQGEVVILRSIMSGELENPQDALEDMFLALENGAEASFYRRLSVVLRDDAKAYWEGWRQRGRGTVSTVRIASTHNGFFDAQVELDFPDGTAMSVHLYCPLRDIWRLDLSFP